ncbi:MAG: endonuclease/exonuclease/phosphatase family protein [Acidobacteriota bacterium]
MRYGLADDGPNSWPQRRQLVFDLIERGRYDFIGLQEALPFQIEEILEAVAGYDVYYRTREIDPSEGEACAVLYRSDRWALDEAESGTLWLSETPETAGSQSWDSSLPRIATWVSVEERSAGRRWHVVNTHFDHRGEGARIESAGIVRELAKSLAASTPVVVLGDFNAAESSAPMLELLRAEGDFTLEDSFRKLHPGARDVGTFNSWTGETAGDKIDAVLVGPGIDVLEAEILRDHEDGRYPSDHYPVRARVVAASP